MSGPTLEVPLPAEGRDPRALRRQFLEGMSHAACTVNVVTTDGVAGRHGVTVSAMVSVSADTPQPTLLVCIHHLSPMADAVLRNGVFCVNVLRDDQSHISDYFAGRSGVQGAAKFQCAEWTTQVTGAPRVIDALVAFDCRVTASERVGSHFVLFGSVQDIVVAGGGAPLIYANRAYGVPQQLRPRSHSTGADAAGADGLAGAAGATSVAAPTDAARATGAARIASASGFAGGAGAAAATLSIGCYQIFAPYIMPALAARLTKLHAGIALTLFEAGQDQLIASLRSQETEVALLYDFGLGVDLHREQLALMTPYVLLPEGHPLADRAGVALDDLVQENLILLDLEPSRDYFLSLFRERGLVPRIGHRSKSLEMVRGLVGHGLGYTLLATKPANNMTYDGRALAVRSLTTPVENSRLVLASLRSRPMSSMAVEFAAHCRSLFGVNHAQPDP